MVRRIIGAYEQMVALARTHDIKVIGGTMMPFVGSTYYHPVPASESDREAVNEWMRTRGHFDAVIDFDKIARDPEHPDRLLPASRTLVQHQLHWRCTGSASRCMALHFFLFSHEKLDRKSGFWSVARAMTRGVGPIFSRDDVRA
jgi:hypothetical protein